MGYSNNKWRKILTILMIVNLSFIIFTKISKVFAYTFEIPAYNKSFNMPEWLDEKKYIFLFNNDTKEFALYWANDEFKMDFEYNFIRVYGIPSGVRSSSVENNYKTPETFQNWLNNLTFEKYNSSSTTSNIVVRNAFGNSLNVSHYCNFDVYNNSNQLVFETTVPNFISPYFDNLTEIKNGYPDGVFISRGDYSENDTLYFHLLKITNTVPDGNQSTYYYDSKVFKLTKDSKYYKTYDADTDNSYSYYYIKRSALTLDTNSSYLYMLSNSGDPISNSYGILQPDIPAGIYDVVESDTAGVITEQQALNDKMTNINNTQQDIVNNQKEIANNSNNINNYLNENTISNDTNDNIDTNLNFDNTATNFSNMYGSFFSRLSSTISNLGSYDLSNIETINMPIPFSQKTISLTSNMVSQHMPEILTSLFTAFWLFIFSKYFLAYILYIYTLIASGRILDNINSNTEIITNDVL